MQKFTQADVDAMPRDEYGIKHCPTGKYEDGIVFDVLCDLGDRCELGDGISYENGRVQDGIYHVVSPIGSRNDRATFYLDGEGNYSVRTGCRHKDIAVFKKILSEVHGGTMYEAEYLLACDYAQNALAIQDKARREAQKNASAS